MAFRGPSRRYVPPAEDTEYLIGAIDRMAKQRPTTSPSISRVNRVSFDDSFPESDTYEKNIAANAPAPNKPRDDDARFERLLAIPSMTREQASRLAYGGKTPPDKDDSTELRQRLAAYMQQPSREAAIAAVRAGANLNAFPDKFAGERGYQPPPPAPGSPEAYAAMEQELQWQSQMSQRYGKPAERKTERVVGDDGFYYLIDSQTGQEIKTNVKAPPRGDDGGSMPFGAGGPPSAVGTGSASAPPSALAAPSDAVAPYAGRGRGAIPASAGAYGAVPPSVATPREYEDFGPHPALAKVEGNPADRAVQRKQLNQLLAAGLSPADAKVLMMQMGYPIQ